MVTALVSASVPGATRRAKTPESEVGARLRMFARGYATTGNAERAAGLLQAADVVDAALAGTTTGIHDDPIVALVVELLERLMGAAEATTEAAADVAAAAALVRELSAGAPSPKASPPAADPLPRRARVRAQASAAAESLGRGERRVLIAVVQSGEGGITRSHLTILTGYKRSTRDRYVQRLQLLGLVREVARRIVPTPQALQVLGPDVRPLPVGAELRAHLLATLPAGEREILRALVREPRSWTRDELTQATGYKRSTRDRYVQKLQARELVDATREGVRASGLLW